MNLDVQLLEDHQDEDDGSALKISTVAAIIGAAAGSGTPLSDTRSLQFLREGFLGNVIGYACVNLIAQSIASLRFVVMRNRSELGRTHPVVRLLEKPAPDTTKARFLVRAATQLYANGDLFIEGVYEGRPSGIPRELHVLRADRMAVTLGPRGPLRYTYRVGGQSRDFPVDPLLGLSPTIMHTRLYNPLDDVFGLSPLRPAAKDIDQHNAAGQHNANLLRNGMRTSGVLYFDGPTSESELRRLKAEIKKRNSGPDNAGNLLILTSAGGGKWNFVDLTTSSRDIDMWRGTQLAARNICAAFGIPHVLIAPDGASDGSRREARAEFFGSVVIPQGQQLLEDIVDWIGTLAYGRDHGLTVQIDTDDIDALSDRVFMQRTAVVSAFRSGIVTRNEARVKLDQPEVPDGDVFVEEIAPDIMERRDPREEGNRSQGTADTGPLSDDSERPTADLAGGADNIARRGARRDTRTRRRRADKAGDDQDDDPFGNILASELLPDVQAAIAAFGQATIDSVVLDLRFDVHDERITSWLRTYGARRVVGIDNTTAAALAETLAAGLGAGERPQEIIARVRRAFAEATRERARIIAETELTAAAAHGTDVALAQMDAQYKIWITLDDDRVRPNHRYLHEKVVPVDAMFVTMGGDMAKAPGGFRLAKNNVGCRCHISVYIPEVDGPDPRKTLGRRLEASRHVILELRSRFEPALANSVSRGMYRQQERILAAIERDPQALLESLRRRTR
jgi:HK97 family phage portal protein